MHGDQARAGVDDAPGPEGDGVGADEGGVRGEVGEGVGVEGRTRRGGGHLVRECGGDGCLGKGGFWFFGFAWSMYDGCFLGRGRCRLRGWSYRREEGYELMIKRFERRNGGSGGKERMQGERETRILARGH